LEAARGVITKLDVEFVNLAVAGNVVSTERVDRMIHNGKPVEAPGMGAFEVSGDKITAWRDYFVGDIVTKAPPLA
jgi:limonene-1,2-epoxide hydrolase